MGSIRAREANAHPFLTQAPNRTAARTALDNAAKAADNTDQAEAPTT